MIPIRDGVISSAGGSIEESGAAKAATDASDKKTAEIKKAAAGFEAILVRQMLTSAKVAGKGGYADMGVEAISTAVTQGGGLGLSHAIEQAVGHAHHAPPPVDTEAVPAVTEKKS
jgi:Rod binding domain-containing protein